MKIPLSFTSMFSSHYTEKKFLSSSFILKIILLAVTASLTLYFFKPSSIAVTTEYNVLLITMDTVRADRIGVYGDKTALTPHLDEFSEKSFCFLNALSSSAATPVSHASILTGLQPYNHGVRVIYAESGCRLPASVETLAERLKKSGRRTAAFLSSFTVSEFYGLNQGFDVFDSGIQESSGEAFQKSNDDVWRWSLNENQRRSDDTTNAALKWLKANKDPFFLWIHYWDPHDPQILPPPMYLAPFTDPSTKKIKKNPRIYEAEIHYMDAQIGRLIRSLKEKGIYNDTMLIITADHGQGLGDHDWWFHRILYQEQIKTPILIRLPRQAGPGVINDLVRTVDIAPTVIDYLDLSHSAKSDGCSLIPVMEGQKSQIRMAYADAVNRYDLNSRISKTRSFDGLLYCAVSEGRKLIYKPDFPEKSEYYNLNEDPGETINLYSKDKSAYRDLLDFLMKTDPFVNKPFGTKMDPEILDRLKSLGYIGDEP